MAYARTTITHNMYTVAHTTRGDSSIYKMQPCLTCGQKSRWPLCKDHRSDAKRIIGHILVENGHKSVGLSIIQQAKFMNTLLESTVRTVSKINETLQNKYLNELLVMVSRGSFELQQQSPSGGSIEKTHDEIKHTRSLSSIHRKRVDRSRSANERWKVEDDLAYDAVRLRALSSQQSLLTTTTNFDELYTDLAIIEHYQEMRTHEASRVGADREPSSVMDLDVLHVKIRKLHHFIHRLRMYDNENAEIQTIRTQTEDLIERFSKEAHRVRMNMMPSEHPPVSDALAIMDNLSDFWSALLFIT